MLSYYFKLLSMFYKMLTQQIRKALTQSYNFCCNKCNINKHTNFFCTNLKSRITELLIFTMLFILTFIHVFNQIIANTYIIFLNFIFTLSQYLSCSHQKPSSKSHRFVVQFRLQLLRISHFSDCFHEVFLYYKIMISTNCKHTCGE